MVKGTVTIFDDIFVPVVLVSGEKPCWGRVHVFSSEVYQAIALAILFLSAPNANNDFTSRSTDTVGLMFRWNQSEKFGIKKRILQL